MPEGMELGSIPQATLIKSTQEAPLKSIQKPPDVISAPDISHLARHWEPMERADQSPAFQGSRFEKNESFRDVHELAEMLTAAAQELIPPDEFNRRHVFTLSFPYPVGRTGITEIQPDDVVGKQMRDQGKAGEAEVNTVQRAELPQTDLLSFDVKPIFPPKGSSEPLKFQIGSAFPGEAAPRLITKARIENHAKKPSSDPSFEEDLRYWQTHAFIVVK